jgi:glycosyltransferase involved in cell wall biosynthesis
MKILQVFDRFSPTGGGIAAVVKKLSQELAEKGHEVTIYTSDFEYDQNYINSIPEVKVISFHSCLNVSGFHLTPGVINTAKKTIKDFDVIHFQCYTSFLNIPIWYYANKYGVPYIIDAHGTAAKTHRKGRKYLFHVAVGKKMLRGASRAVAETQQGIKEYKDAGIREDRIIKIQPGFDIKEYSKLPVRGSFIKKYKLSGKKIILFLGRIHWIKGIDFVIESFAELIKNRQDLILVVVGQDDGYKVNLEKMVVKLNISDKVFFPGFLSLEDKIASLVDAEMLVQPSRYEQGVAWTSIEAIMCDTPVIISKNTGASQDIDEMGGGYMVDFGNKNELVKIINSILADNTEAKNITERQKYFVKEKLSLEKKTIEFEELYRQCIEEKDSVEKNER